MRKLNRVRYLAGAILLSLFLSGCADNREISFEQATEHFSSETQEELSEKSSEKETLPSFLYVDVAGAVNKPGVVKLPGGSRVYEAIEQAGGFREEAKQDSVNQAAFLEDGQQLYIYTEEEYENFSRQPGGADASAEAADGTFSADGKININQASEAELMTLPGIGEAKAADILRYREENGRFEQIEDIMNISGIKEAVFSKIKDKIMV